MITNYVYQYLHTWQHRALHLGTHLELLNRALEDVHAVQFAVGEAELQDRIGSLLREGRYPMRSNQITLEVYPHGEQGNNPRPTYRLTDPVQLLYDKYVVWQKRLMLEVFPSEYLFMGYPTAMSQLCAQYADAFARRVGADVAVVENMEGVLTNINDEPLFLLFDETVVTSPPAQGATDSVMRSLIYKGCMAEGVALEEVPLTRKMLEECDEAFTASPQGLVSIMGYREIRYFNFMVHRIAQRISAITASETQHK